LCTAKHPVTLPKVVYPKPNIHASLVAKVKGEEDKIASGLAALHEEDPTFLYVVDSELHQTIISAQGELHLEVVADRLRRRHNVHVNWPSRASNTARPSRAGAIPSISPQETDRRRGAVRRGLDAHRTQAARQRRGVHQSLVGQNVDRVFVPSVEKGVKQACTEGILAGCRVTDVKIDFYDGKMHPVDSKDIAFQIAGYFAFKEAFTAAKPCLLEPIETLKSAFRRISWAR
jgi:elongation factor G